MTRKQKFQPGDLIVLKKNCRIIDWPGYSLWDLELEKIVKERTSIKHVCTNGTSYKANVFKGTVGVVKSYENVFMLESRQFDQKRFDELKAKDEKHTTVTVDANTLQKRYYINSWTKKHMIVLMNGMLVAFKSGDKLFEHASDTLNRHASVDVHISGVLKFENVDDKELQARIKKSLSRLGKELHSQVVVHIECVDRDGNVKAK